MTARARLVAGVTVLLCSAGAYFAAPRLAPLPRPHDVKRLALDELGALARPFRALLGFTRALVLPFLWTAANEADRLGRTSDAVALGRWIAFMLPESNVVWTVFGWRLAYDFSGAVSTPDEEIERILAGLRWMETGSQVLEDDAELCLTIALVLQDRLGSKDERSRRNAEAYRQRTGKDPLEVAEGWLLEAERRNPEAVRFWRFALNAEERARAAWRAGDMRATRHWAETARVEFEKDGARGDADSAAAAADLERAVRALDVLIGGVPRASEEGREALRILAESRLSLK